MIDSGSVAREHENYLIEQGVEPTVARDQAEQFARCLKSVENH